MLFHLFEYRAEDMARTELDATGACKIIIDYFIYNAGQRKQQKISMMSTQEFG